MTISDTTTPAASTALPEIALQLAASLHRRVTVREGASSAPVGRVSGASEQASLLAVPVHDDGVRVAVIEIDLGDGPQLAANEFDAVDAAVALARRALRGVRGSSGVDRESVFVDLLHAEESARRDAYARAVRQRWLQPGAGTVVRAVLIDAAVSDVDRIAFGRHLAHLRPAPAHFMALEHGVVLLVGPPSDSGLTDLLLDEAARRGIRILGMGTASPVQGATELRSAADEAMIAASLAAALPQFHPAVDSSALGGWRLLASATADPAALRTISPAAHALYSQRDDSQRVTVETYLDVGANVVAACRILFVHRTTLYYRLERLPEVVREALDDGVARSTLHLALKLIRLWEATGRL
nr:helix-turn-helix domain-containing protein [Microbacterium hydrocarbonoxydans]